MPGVAAALLESVQHLEHLVNKQTLRAEDMEHLQGFIGAANDYQLRTLGGRAILEQRLAYQSGFLLTRVLEQNKHGTAARQRKPHCDMVHSSAAVLSFVLKCALDGPPGARHKACISVAGQLTASGLLPKLAAAVSQLANRNWSAQQLKHCTLAASALLDVAVGVISIWPGQAGVFTSAAAQPLAQPAVQLAAGLVEHTAEYLDSSKLQLLCHNSLLLVRHLPRQATSLMACVARQYKQQGGHLQQRQHLAVAVEIFKLPGMLLLLLTFLQLAHGACMEPTATGASISLGPDTAAAGQAYGPVSSPGSSSGTGAATAVSSSTAAVQLHRSASSGPAASVQPAKVQTVAGAAHPTALEASHGGSSRQDYHSCTSNRCDIWASLQCTTEVACASSPAALCLDVTTVNSLLDSVWLCLQPIMEDMRNHVVEPLKSSSGSSSKREQRAARRWCQQLYESHASSFAALDMLPVQLLQLLDSAVLQQGFTLELLDSHYKPVCDTMQCIVEFWSLLVQIQLLLPGVLEAQLDEQQQQPPINYMLQLLLSQVNLLLQQRDQVAAADRAGLPAIDRTIDCMLQLISQLGMLSLTGDWHLVVQDVTSVLEQCLRTRYYNSVTVGGNSGSSTACHSRSHSKQGSDTEAEAQPQQQQEQEQEPIVHAGTAAAAAAESKLSLACQGFLCPAEFYACCTCPKEPVPPALAAAAASSRGLQQLLLFMVSLQKQAISPQTVQSPTPCNKSLIAAADMNLSAAITGAMHVLNAVLPCTDGSSGSSRGGFVGSSKDLLPAAAPCLVIVARTIIHRVKLLQACLGSLEATAALSPDHPGASSSSSSTSEEDAVIQELEQCTVAAVQELQRALDWVCDVMVDKVGSSNSGGSGGSSGGGSSSLGSAGPTSAADTGAVTDMQLSEILRIQQQMEADTEREGVLGLHTCGPVGATFLQQLHDLGESVCAVLPLPFCCNNPSCSYLSKSSELFLVNGRSCVCGGCETARYCSRECQAAQWLRHKRICKVIRRHSKVSN